MGEVPYQHDSKNICVLYLKECVVMFQHNLATLCVIFSVTLIMVDGWVKEDTLDGLMFAIFQSSGLLSVETPKTPCVWSSCSQQRGTSPLHCGCLLDQLQIPQHLGMNMLVHEEKCRGMH
jgi:hypothetical protein